MPQDRVLLTGLPDFITPELADETAAAVDQLFGKPTGKLSLRIIALIHVLQTNTK